MTTTAAVSARNSAEARAQTILDAAEGLIPVLQARAAQTDADRRISDDTFAQLRDARLFDILKPAAFGGLELDDYTHARVAMTLARGCASTAWVFSILSSDNTAILAFPGVVHEEIWGANTSATLAGNLNFNARATAESVAGGYLLSGRWSFCSGSDFSEWLIFNAPAGEAQESHMFLVPSQVAVTIDDWFPTGMRGSGSRSMEIDGAFVPSRHVMRTSDIPTGLSNARANYPEWDGLYSDWPPHSRFPFAAVAVGAALGAVEYFGGTVGHSSRVATALGGTVSLADQDYVASEFMAAAGDAHMARLLIESTSRRSAARARRHETSRPDELAIVQRDNALAARAAMTSVQRIFALIGSRVGMPSHPVSIAKRDIEMISHHVSVNWRQAAVRYLGSIAAQSEAG